jgi:hypothetical protein
MILQQIETEFSLDMSTASYSAFCELYAKNELVSSASKSQIDLTAIKRILEMFAEFAFDKNEREISIYEFKEIISKYQQHHRMTVDKNNLIKTLIETELIRSDQSYIEFAQNYQYRFFVASSIVEILPNDRVLALSKITRLASEMHLENSASILVLLGYLAQDNEIIQIIFEKAKSSLTDFIACDFDKSTEFARNLIDKIPQITLKILENPLVARLKVAEAV